MMGILKPAVAQAAMLAASAALAETDARAVWQRHVQAASSGDIEAVMQDFDESSAIITPEGVHSGTAAIRGFFEEFLGGLDPAEVVVNAELVHDDVVVFNFTVGDPGLTFHDTALIRDGRIAVLSTVSYPHD